MPYLVMAVALGYARLGLLASAQLPSVASTVGACLLHCTGTGGKNVTHSHCSCVTVDRGRSAEGLGSKCNATKVVLLQELLNSIADAAVSEQYSMF